MLSDIPVTIVSVSILCFLCGPQYSWDKLSHTGPSFTFTIPLKEGDAEAANYQEIDADFSCVDSPFTFTSGYRWVEPSTCDPDILVTAVFDNNSHISGVQISFAKQSVTPQTEPWFSIQHSLNQENIKIGNNNSNSYRTATMYFYDEDKICTTGRTNMSIQANPVGEKAIFLNGSNFVEIPKQQSDVQSPNMTFGKCVDKKGKYAFFRNINSTTNCNDLQPFFGLYNNGQLNGFGIMVPGEFNSCFGETQNYTTLSAMFSEVPDCMKPDGQYPVWTSIHFIFFDKDKIKCCPLC